MVAHNNVSYLIKKHNIRHILILERYIMLPVKVMIIIASFYFLRSLEPSIETKYYFFQLKLYVIANLIFLMSIICFGKRHFRPVMVRCAAFFLSLIDNLYVGFLIYFTGGLESELYMMYPALLIRNAINFPKIKYQEAINLSCIFFYIGALYSVDKNFSFITNEVFLLRITTLVLVSICCWGIYFLIQKKYVQKQDEYERVIRSEKLKVASNLTSQVAHELKNPLCIINNATYLIKKNTDSNSEKILRNTDIIEQQVTRSNKIITELLDYSRFSQGRIQRVNVNDVLTKIVMNDFKDDIEVISFIFENGLPDLLIDEKQFIHLICHVISNSLESVKSVNNDEPEIKIITAINDDDFLEIHVIDNGKGISEENYDQIFNPFFTTKENHIGLGLSIVKNIAQTYTAKVNISSNGYGGCTLSVFFPVKTKAKKELSLL